MNRNFLIDGKDVNISLAEADQIAKWYDVASTAEYLQDNYGFMMSEEYAMALSEKIRSKMAKYGCDEELAIEETLEKEKVFDHFCDTKTALLYAETLGKYSYAVADVCGETSVITSTSLPEEEWFRTKLEKIASDFLSEVLSSNTEVCDFGAEITGIFSEKMEEYFGFKFLSANQEF